ncbi:MAG: hypothetical protein IPM95_00710 [Sphingobacteriales bacterium]|nr:hypothetical protein [Sphingobacteriales bacterium]
MRTVKTLSYVLLMVALATSGCSKLSSSTDTGVPSAPSPSFSGDVKGTLVSLRTSFSYDPNKFINPKPPISLPVVDVDAETAVAAFSNDFSSGVFLDGGAVSVNTNPLDKLSNNTYTKLAFDYTSPSLDLDFGSGSNWSVAGNGDVPSISYNHTTAFPNYSGKADLPETVSSSADLTISLTGKISSADSVYVLLLNGSKQILKRVGGGASSVTISASDISGLGTTGGNATAILEVCPWNFIIETISTKKYAFVKEQAVVKYVKIN